MNEAASFATEGSSFILNAGDTMNNVLLEAGKLVNTHGVRGELKLLPYTDGPEFLLPFRALYWKDGSGVTVKSSRVQGTCLLLKLAGVDSIEAASPLIGKTLYFRRDDPAIPSGTVFISDLIGLPVFSDGAEIGKITDVIQAPGNDVYVVKGQKEYMIPVVPAFVDPVQLSEGRVNVRLIEGMESS